MFTLLSFRHGLKIIERDLNPLTYLSTLYVCHIFSNYYLLYEMSRGPTRRLERTLQLFVNIKHLPHLSAQQANCLLRKNQKSIQTDLNISEMLFSTF